MTWKQGLTSSKSSIWLPFNCFVFDFNFLFFSNPDIEKITDGISLWIDKRGQPKEQANLEQYLLEKIRWSSKSSFKHRRYYNIQINTKVDTDEKFRTFQIKQYLLEII